MSETDDLTKSCFIHFDDYIYWGTKQYANTQQDIGEICHLPGKHAQMSKPALHFLVNLDLLKYVLIYND